MMPPISTSNDNTDAGRHVLIALEHVTFISRVVRTRLDGLVVHMTTRAINVMDAAIDKELSGPDVLIQFFPVGPFQQLAHCRWQARLDSVSRLSVDVFHATFIFVEPDLPQRACLRATMG